MAGYRATEIRKPADDAEFERNCVVLFRDILQDPDVKRVGTNGQDQNGVDVIGQRQRDPNRLVGVQCKLKLGRSRLTAAELKDEVQKALTFSPSLNEYFVVATSKDDTKLQQLALQITQDQLKAGRQIHIEVWGWDTLQDKINQSEKAKQAFDPGYSPSIAAQTRKLDAILVGQTQQATSDQLAAVLARSVEKHISDVGTRLPPAYADRELKEVFTRILRRRGFAQTDAPRELADLAKRAIDGDLSPGSSAIRAEICYRAARANAAPVTVQAAKAFRDAATRLDPSRDMYIADALLLEADGDPNGVLRQPRNTFGPVDHAGSLSRSGGSFGLCARRGTRSSRPDSPRRGDPDCA